MKRISLFLLFFLTTLSSNVFAQKLKSTLNIRLSDDQPLLVTINGRDYKKVNRTISIADLPGKRHQLQVYRFVPYSDAKGGKASLVFSGKIKITPGNQYDAIVDVKQKKLLLKALVPGSYPANRDLSGSFNNSGKDIAIGNGLVSDPKLARLQGNMLAERADSKKLHLAKQFLNQETVNTKDIRLISTWIMFDDNRMLLFKEAKTKVTDPENFGELEEVFTMPESKSEFRKLN